jgi:hypothetical protein
MSGCKPQFTKKYLSRPSPNFPANKCRGQSLVGQDGHMYRSKSDSRGIYRWSKIHIGNLDFLNKKPLKKTRKVSKKKTRKVSKKKTRKVSKKKTRK